MLQLEKQNMTKTAAVLISSISFYASRGLLSNQIIAHSLLPIWTDSDTEQDNHIKKAHKGVDLLGKSADDP